MEDFTYKEFINNILETRGRFACGNEYHESHHIVPKCMGGSNDKENLIDLYAREHFEAHRLLALENPNNEKLVYAWWCMSVMQNEFEDRYNITAEEYEEIKTKYVLLLSDKMSGDGNHFYGKKHTEESREKISKNHANISGENNPMFGKHHSEEAKTKIQNRHIGRTPWNKGKKMSHEFCLKNSETHKGKQIGELNPFYNKHHTKESKEKMRQNKKGKYIGENNPMYGSGKSVVQLSIDYQVIAEYISALEAYKITKVNKSGIYRCCNGTQKTAGGFIWKYKKEWEEMQSEKNIDGQN